MLWILALIIILYVFSYLVWHKNENFLKLREWIDIGTLITTSVIVISWAEIFHYSFYFVLYFILSISAIIYLTVRLHKTEIKKKKAEQFIKVLKDKEGLLEEELQNANSKS